MIDFKNPEKINEYDRIISEWPDDEKIGPMRYIAVEDIKNRCWIVYDSQIGLYKEVPFGFYTECIINGYILSDQQSVHYEKTIETLKKNEVCFDEEANFKLYKDSKDVISKLFYTLSNLSYWKSLAKKGELISSNGHCLSQSEFEKVLLDEWKRYRFACFPKIWMNFIDFNENNEATEESTEFNLSVNRIVTASFVCFCDYISFEDKEGIFRTGKGFVMAKEHYLYYWDLYHVLVSNCTETAHICPRCNTLFFSNNNKSLYCDTCKGESNIIRSENRMKSVRYLHKKIYDKINNSKYYSNADKEMFLAESNYYWDVVRGKQSVGSSKQYNNNIVTQDDYLCWLQQRLEYYKEKRK